MSDKTYRQARLGTGGPPMREMVAWIDESHAQVGRSLIPEGAAGVWRVLEVFGNSRTAFEASVAAHEHVAFEHALESKNKRKARGLQEN